MSSGVSTISPVGGLSEASIRPDDIFEAFLELCAADAENFFDRRRFHDIACPACGNSDAGPDSFVKHGFRYANCPSCRSLYVSPRPSQAELLRFYAESKSCRFWSEKVLGTTGEKRREGIVRPAVERITGILAEHNMAPRRVLDVGAGNGSFLGEWQARHREAKLCAIEPGPVGAAACRALGAEVFEGMVEEADGAFVGAGDLVTCFEVLEHVGDPSAFARALCRVTAPGGIVIVTGLVVTGFDIQILWDLSRSVMPPHHLNFLSRGGVVALFQAAGFKRVEVRTPGRLDVDIVRRARDRGDPVALSRFEQLIVDSPQETQAEFQRFLAANGLSSHAWAICIKE